MKRGGGRRSYFWAFCVQGSGRGGFCVNVNSIGCVCNYHMDGQANSLMAGNNNHNRIYDDNTRSQTHANIRTDWRPLGMFTAGTSNDVIGLLVSTFALAVMITIVIAETRCQSPSPISEFSLPAPTSLSSSTPRSSSSLKYQADHHRSELCPCSLSCSHSWPLTHSDRDVA